MTSIALFGHRGARGLAPENTIAGFATARSFGVTGVEFDIGLTRDGIAVVHHDPRLHADVARDAAGHYVGLDAPMLASLTREQVAGYDVGRLRAGSDYAARYPDQVARDGAAIPALAEALAALDGLDLLIEIKTNPERPADTASPRAMAAAVIAELRAAGAIERAVLFAFDWRVLREAASLEPRLRRCCLTESDTVAKAGLWLDGADLGAFRGQVVHAVAATGVACWAPFHATLEAADISEAKALGLFVLPWTVNTAEAFDRMIGFGVDGIITDRPDLARNAIAQAGFTIAAPGFVAGISRLVPEIRPSGGVEQKLP